MSASRLSVAVIQGGPSSEAEVSRASAKGVADALKQAGHAVVRLELNDHLAESLRTGGYDVVFPVVHGAVGEDGSLQGLLEVLGLSYVGANVLASALAMDKPFAKKIFSLAGIPVPEGIALSSYESPQIAADRARSEIGGALVVKPAANGSAIGVARLEANASEDDLANAIAAVWEIDAVALVESFLRGREVTCGVLDLDGEAKALPPTEIKSPNDAFYTYAARYAAGRSVHTCPAELGEKNHGARTRARGARAHRARVSRSLSRRFRGWRNRGRRHGARAQHDARLHCDEPLPRSGGGRGHLVSAVVRFVRAPSLASRWRTSKCVVAVSWVIRRKKRAGENAAKASRNEFVIEENAKSPKKIGRSRVSPETRCESAGQTTASCAPLMREQPARGARFAFW